jgi:uncharacterized protein (TIGR03118 family)
MPATSILSIYPATIFVGESANLVYFSPDGDQLCTVSGDSQSSIVTPTTAGTQTYTITCPLDGGGMTSSSAMLTTLPPGNAYANFVMVSNTAAGGGATVDPNLVNPWGIYANSAFEGEDGADPVAALAINGASTGLDEVFFGSLPATPALFPAGFAPTGIVFGFAGLGEFQIPRNPCVIDLVAVSTSGQLAGWASNFGCPPGETTSATATIAYTANDGAVYTGLTWVEIAQGTIQSPAYVGGALYAADFHNAKIDVFNGSLAKSEAPFPFTDPTLPPGYAPFNVQAICAPYFNTIGFTYVYVTYAQRDPQNPDSPAIGAGLGLVDIFASNGKFLTRLIPPGGELNAPWGVVLAPADFGGLSNALLIANHGDGHINGYDPTTGKFLGSVLDPTGAPLVVPGIRGIAFPDEQNFSVEVQGNDALFYTAGDAVQGTAGMVYVIR